MPYTDASTRGYFDKHPHEAKTPGDLTYVIYRLIYKMWKESSRFSTYFLLARGQRTPSLIPVKIQGLMKTLMKNGVGAEDIFAAYDCAVLELYVRHVAAYEAEKMRVNGDVSTEDVEIVKEEVQESK